MKLAFVVQRYGPTIAGGSEAHCRELARRLASTHDITVLSTCASDYVTWENTFPPGESRDAGVRVLRFPVAHPRRLKRFADLSDDVFSGGASVAREEEWFRENGPEAPALLDYLRREGRGYDLVLFWAYRYAPSYFGVPIVADRAVLVPTAEEDAAIDFAVLQEYFRKPSGFLFLTPEEQALVAQRAGGQLPPSAVIGIGLDPPPPVSGGVLDQLRLPDGFLLYLGRIDRNKGCHTLLEYFEQYLQDDGRATLVLAGPSKIQVPAHPRIRSLGYVADDVRHALFSRAQALVVPSPYESLSIVLLEAWNHGVPAVVNGRCRVLEGQVRRANGGLSYRTAREFASAVEYLLGNGDARDTLGRQGRSYVEREYRWPAVLTRVEALLTELRRRRT